MISLYKYRILNISHYEFVQNQLALYRPGYKRYYNKVRIVKYRRRFKRKKGSYVLLRTYLVVNRLWYGCKKNTLTIKIPKFYNYTQIPLNNSLTSLVIWFFKNFLKKKYPLFVIKKMWKWWEWHN